MNKLFFLLSILLILTNACKKLERINPLDVEGKTNPVLMTSAIDSISNISAKSGGEIKSDGGLPIIAKGVCWSTNTNPTINDNKTNNGTGSEKFTCIIKGLIRGTKYYVRAYTINSKGTYYGNEVSFKTLFDGLGQMLSDVDGNTYKTVYIGTQQWMAENLKVSKYSDGSSIPNITDKIQWSNLTSGAWAYYNNDAANNVKYGKLYNWYAVSPTTNGNKNVCPTGWHVPTDEEWTVLTDYLGGINVAEGKMKEVGTSNWNSPNTGATNTSLFSALPGGYRNYVGNFNGIGADGYWSSSSLVINFNPSITYDKVWLSHLGSANGVALSSIGSKRTGLSVRCLRD